MKLNSKMYHSTWATALGFCKLYESTDIVIYLHMAQIFLFLEQNVVCP